MLKMSLSSILKITLVAALSVPAILSIPVGSTAAASPDIVSGALTAPPPPEEHTVHSLAALKYIYQAAGNVSPGGGLTANVTTSTTTYKEMKSLQVNYRLERWTGSNWVTYRSGTKSKTQTQSLSAQSSWTVITGYYYRVVSTHTANDGTNSENTTDISNSVLL
ncbi:hypothetical protein [Paenibacillus illinoisensis]|uniref:hypothetical protein n=1 Tax=Paenibacillus illinoisensis TaxID=59845 RepID=UPI002040156B|nr:hypothetical protein [Paenibacillus illinoisensis]MCM3203232.1 hypothetical protein [Paenibacillus illinoisensis]